MSFNQQRSDLIKIILEDETIIAEEDEILHMLLKQQITKNLNSENENKLTAGQKAADKLAKFAGSWVFIITFFIILTAWIVLNAVILVKPYDVYPFILLNLILSCLASIQAPIIMMSQNRQEEKDRIRAINDYKVNLKAEIMIEDIHEKLDILIDKQQEVYERLNALEKPTNSFDC